jgi:hypothetical protein
MAALHLYPRREGYAALAAVRAGLWVEGQSWRLGLKARRIVASLERRLRGTPPTGEIIVAGE